MPRIPSLGFGLLLLFGSLVFIACEIDTGGADASSSPSSEAGSTQRWRRSATGWEDATAWQGRPMAAPLKLHPLTLAGMMILISLTALVAIPSQDHRRDAARAVPPVAGEGHAADRGQTPHFGRARESADLGLLG